MRGAQAAKQTRQALSSLTAAAERFSLAGLSYLKYNISSKSLSKLAFKQKVQLLNTQIVEARHRCKNQRANNLWQSKFWFSCLSNYFRGEITDFLNCCA